MKEAASPALTRISEQIRDALTRMNARERGILIVGSILVALTLLWTLYGWQAKTQGELNVALPRATAQLARMQSESAELARLRGLPPPTPANLGQLTSTLEGTATAHGLTLNIRNDGSQLVVSGKGVNFDKWVPWLAEAQRGSAIRLTYLDVTQGPGGPQLEARLAPL